MARQNFQFRKFYINKLFPRLFCDRQYRTIVRLKLQKYHYLHNFVDDLGSNKNITKTTLCKTDGTRMLKFNLQHIESPNKMVYIIK